jgi:hypothetical protein
MSGKAILLLGRYGDVINALPLAWHIAQTQEPPFFIISKEYASVLDGVSYVRPVPVNLEFNCVGGALEWAQATFKKVLPMQVYGQNHRIERHKESYNKESWRLVGAWPLWGSLPLVFDMRDHDRERELMKRARKTHKPIILTNFAGTSSPFDSAAIVGREINRIFGKKFEVIDVSFIRASHIFDLLGLFEAAKAIVTIDTALLHLARAVKTPVVALTADTMSRWHCSSVPPNTFAAIRYSDATTTPQIVTAALSGALGTSEWKSAPNTKMHHVCSMHEMTGESLRRHAVAKTSWESEYASSNLAPSYIWQRDVKRDSRTQLRDRRNLFFIKDMLDIAAARSGSEDEILVLTNADVGMLPGTARRVGWLVSRFGSCFGHRMDWFEPIKRPLTRDEVLAGRWYCGSDLFGMSVGWWKLNRAEYPDMLVGSEAWDWIMRELMISKGGVILEGALYHEHHERQNLEPGRTWNRRHATSWLRARGIHLAELA